MLRLIQSIAQLVREGGREGEERRGEGLERRGRGREGKGVGKEDNGKEGEKRLRMKE